MEPRGTLQGNVGLIRPPGTVVPGGLIIIVEYVRNGKKDTIND